MKFILNIGEKRSSRSDSGEICGGQFVTRCDVYMSLHAAGLNKLYVEYRRNVGRENTYIVVVECINTITYDRICTLCNTLDQDCVAIAWYEDERFVGVLRGPRAKEWGKFDPTLFDMPENYKV